MPARKPSTLSDRHNTKADRAARVASESAMTPRTELTRKPPASLTGHKIAIATWKRVVGLYAELEGKIATSFDEDLLVKYCMLEEEVIELTDIRGSLKDEWGRKFKEVKQMKISIKNFEEIGMRWEVVNKLFARFQGIDARLDGKRKLLHALSMSLYLTPRSRAGVEPPMKEPEAPQSEMEKVLNG